MNHAEALCQRCLNQSHAAHTLKWAYWATVRPLPFTAEQEINRLLVCLQGEPIVGFCPTVQASSSEGFRLATRALALREARASIRV